MSRMAQSHAVERATEISHDRLYVELSQLVFRLQQNILHPTPEQERLLVRDRYQRVKTEANIRHGVTLLERLEQDALNITPPAARLERQDALHARRETLEALSHKMEDIKQLAVDADEDDDSDLNHVVMTPSESAPSSTAEPSNAITEGQSSQVEESTPPPQPQLNPIPDTPARSTHRLPIISPTTPLPPTTRTTQSLRARRSASSQPPKPEPADASHSTARSTLFDSRRGLKSPRTSTATAEAILDQQRAEQESLSGSILQMASALKASSQRFSSSLEADKDVVSRTTEGMDKTERGMDAARGRMGALRRMTEGKGWWGRMMLYAWIYGLMVMLLLIVFVMPKLRF